MNKYQLALNRIKTLEICGGNGSIYRNYANSFNIAKEDIDTLQECVDKVEMYEEFTIPNLRKILKILKTKGVDVLELQACIEYSKFVNPLEGYNNFLCNEKLKLTQEEYEILKEWLE